MYFHAHPKTKKSKGSRSCASPEGRRTPRGRLPLLWYQSRTPTAGCALQVFPQKKAWKNKEHDDCHLLSYTAVGTVMGSKGNVVHRLSCVVAHILCDDLRIWDWPICMVQDWITCVGVNFCDTLWHHDPFYHYLTCEVFGIGTVACFLILNSCIFCVICPVGFFLQDYDCSWQAFVDEYHSSDYEMKSDQIYN